MDFGFIEGGRLFSIAFGTVTGAACLAIAVPLLWWLLPRSRVSFFTTAIDPHGGLQLAYGIFAMAMAWTDVLCRYIPHGALPWVHPAFLLTTLLLVGLLGPRVLQVALAQRPLAAGT